MTRSPRGRHVLLAALVVTAFALITIDYRAGRVEPLRAGIAAVVGPLQRAAAAVTRPVAGAVSDVRTLGRSKERIAALERENADLRRELTTSGLDQARVQEVDRLLSLAGRAQYRVVPARVIAAGAAPGGFERTVSIDVGRRDGVRRDMTVMAPDGLAGRVIAAAATTSTVLLLPDPIASVGARLEGSLELGAVTGTGATDQLTFVLFDPTASVRAGDRLVSFGSPGGTPYVPEIPIGTVTAVHRTAGALTQSAQVRPFVDFTALDVVGVVVAAPAAPPRDSVLPPRPAAQPTPSAP